MSRDYKNSKRRAAGSGNLSGIAGFVVGLALGLAVAVGVYLFDRRPAARLAQESPPMTRDEAPAAKKATKPAPASQDAETQFEFYEMLPKFEVVIPEQDGTSAPAAGPGTGPVEKPGAYILQA